MKISRNWLQTFFDTPLPEAQTLADALTFHVFEIESVEGDVLDVKVTPNRGHDCLSHRGIAKEISAILKMPMKSDPLRTNVSLTPRTDIVAVSIDLPAQAGTLLCPRYIAGYIRGVKVAPSPEWLQKSLEAVGQKSINNVVDATNFVMFDLGQPLHAFDAAQLKQQDGTYAITVSKAKKGEKMLALDDKEYTFADSMLTIRDAHAGTAIGIAGVKGGKPAGITEATTDIIVESANFDGVSVRKIAQTLKLRTDASQRFEQGISSELAAYGMRAAAELIIKLTGGEIVGFVDEYPRRPEQKTVSVSVEAINKILGTELTVAGVADVFTRLEFAYKEEGEVFDVMVPFERLDLVILEDLVEEVGRIIGYDRVPSTELSPFPKLPEINKNFYAAERVREELMAQEYSEVYTSVFSDKGERAVLNKVDSVRPYLRANLLDGLAEALKKNISNKDLLGLKEIKLFEIGTVWKGGKEQVMVGIIEEKGKALEKLLEGGESKEYEGLSISAALRFEQFSKYPYIVRDIALWAPDLPKSEAIGRKSQFFRAPAGTEPEQVLGIIRTQASGLLIRSEKFDEFKKGKKTSYAFRLIFQSFEKTLTDEEVNRIMEKISTTLTSKGFEIR